MKLDQFRKLSVNELKIELLALYREKFNTHIQYTTRELKQTHNIKLIRRNIARLNTILHEKHGKNV